MLISIAEMSFLSLPWKYINEGNLHIVLQVLGTDYVIRLIKEDENPVDLRTIQEAIDFVNVVMQPLLSISNLRQELIELTSDELRRLGEDLLKLRPEKRKHKSELCCYAIKATNLSILNTEFAENYCIEIKPKEGFMASGLKQTGKCYYCLKQFLKVEENLIQKKSHYCPLDLFSGQKHRIKWALSSLVDSPQNNFKIFKDGTVIFGENSNENDLELILIQIPAFQQSNNVFLEFITEVLLCKKDRNSVLKTHELMKPENKQFCNGQQTLDPNVFLYKLFTLQNLAEEIHFNYNEVSTENNTNYVSDMISTAKVTPKELLLNKFSQTELALISAVARDCSIMIAFTPKYEANFPYVQIGEHKVSYKVSVTDLEPKGVKTLVKRGKTEKKLLTIYKKYLEETGNNSSCKYQSMVSQFQNLQ